MSYDLEVYAKHCVAPEELLALLQEAGLHTDKRRGEPAFEVLRTKRRKYTFTLSHAISLEAEDVPIEVTSVALGVRWLYEILVEGSSTSEISHATRFARHLARASAGIVHDRQTDKIWRSGKLRAVEAVKDERIDLLELEWFTSDFDILADLPSAWLRIARQFLPEALPRRFGSYEPLSGNLSRDGDSAFVEAVQKENRLLFFNASRPCISGHFPGALRDRNHVAKVSLTLHRGPIQQTEWRDAVRRLFIAVAQESRAFYAMAEVKRNANWTGRTLYFDGAVERSTILAWRDGWCGLPSHPVWWSWFGSAYKPYVDEYLKSRSVAAIDYGDSLLYERSDLPADRDELSRSKVWLPEELLAFPETGDPHIQNPPPHRAAVVPPELGRD